MKLKMKKSNKLSFENKKPSRFALIFNRLFANFAWPIFFLMLAGILIVLAQWYFLNRKGESFAVGQPAPETYRVITAVLYDDQEAAKNLRIMIRDSIAGVTVRDISAKSRLQQRLEALNGSKARAYLPEPLVKALAAMNEIDRARILNLAYQIGRSYIDRLEAEKIFMNNTVETSILWDEINKNITAVNDANFVYQILAGLGNLNLRIDGELTDIAKRAAVNDVPNIDRKLEPGDVIISRGEIVTKQTANLLRLQGYTEDVFPLFQLCVVFLSVIIFPIWLNILGCVSGDKGVSWRCVAFLILTAWIGEVLAARFRIHGAGIVPVVTLAYLCINDYAAFCISLIGASTGIFIITGQAVSNLNLLALMSIAGATLGHHFLRNLNIMKQHIITRVLFMSLSMTLIRMLMLYFQGPDLTRDSFRLFVPLGEFWRITGLYLLYEGLATCFVVFMLPSLENYIGVLSVLSLREVSHPSNPMLRDLQRNAPGTYQHSLTIAMLIEAVGLKLGMNINLLRAGAYYHDIGKLRRPSFFVENQGGGLNVHDEMSPMLSAITIISHVKDGLELAWEAKLPKRIRDFIAEHHGTTCVRYFYNKSVSEGQNVQWSSFCYPGPKPQSRETALLMIVDSVEAAVRAANIRELENQDNNRGKGQGYLMIEKIVRQVINSKINEGQFDEAGFTLKDLAVIRQTLIDVLMSMYHTRHVKKIDKEKKS